MHQSYPSPNFAFLIDQPADNAIWPIWPRGLGSAQFRSIIKGLAFPYNHHGILLRLSRYMSGPECATYSPSFGTPIRTKVIKNGSIDDEYTASSFLVCYSGVAGIIFDVRSARSSARMWIA